MPRGHAFARAEDMATPKAVRRLKQLDGVAMAPETRSDWTPRTLF
jgi:hypothetical protein